MTSNDQTPDPTHEGMYSRIYFEAQTALDEILGPDEEDGAGAGLVAEIWHLAEQRDQLRRDMAIAHAAGYAEAVSALRDDARYLTWWTSAGVKPDGPVRQHLADYLETAGPDPSTV